MAKATSSNLKAASTLVNCGCQCSRFAFSFILMLDMLSQNFPFPIFSGCKTFSSLTFLDSGGQVQGNCLTVDSTGARWCYTSHGSTCQVNAIKANWTQITNVVTIPWQSHFHPGPDIIRSVPSQPLVLRGVLHPPDWILRMSQQHCRSLLGEQQHQGKPFYRADP